MKEGYVPVIPVIPPPVKDTIWSGSSLVNVMILPDSAIVKPVPAVIVTAVEPVVLELIKEVFPAPAPTVREPSFVTEPSTSVIIPVLVIVAFPDVPDNDIPVPAVSVTSVPLLLLSVSGEDVPEIVKSVVPPVEAIVTMASSPVPDVVSVTFDYCFNRWYNRLNYFWHIFTTNA